MDVEGLVEQLLLDERLPGVALLIAREVIESAVIVDSGLGTMPAAWLRTAGEHLHQIDETPTELAGYAWLPSQLVDIAAAGRLPGTDQLGPVRNALRDLVRLIPAEGSVPADVEYAGY